MNKLKSEKKGIRFGARANEIVYFDSDVPATHYFSYNDRKFPGNKWVHYEVRGTIKDMQTETRLKFSKYFTQQKDAEKYFRLMKECYPESSILLSEKTLSEKRMYQ